jgi:hypothetical protein
VWGWLIALTLRPSGRVTPAAVILALGAAGAAAQQAWRSGAVDLAAMAGGIAAGFLLHTGWLAHLRHRAELSSH